MVSTLALFLVLTGAAAFAAAKISGKQLKSNAVTTAKIKEPTAVTTPQDQDHRDLRREAQGRRGDDGEKIVDGSVSGEKIDLCRDPLLTGHLQAARQLGDHRAGGLDQVYPLDSSTYTQAAEELDSYAGAIDVTLPPPNAKPPAKRVPTSWSTPKDPTSSRA